MKSILFLLLLSVAVTTAHSQIVGANRHSVQKPDTIAQFNIRYYGCYASSFLDVTIRKQRKEYVTSWSITQGMYNPQEPRKGTIVLTEEQLTSLKNFARNVSPAAVHEKDCSGTTFFKFTSSKLNNEQQLCNCAQNVWGELLRLINVQPSYP